MVPVLCVFVLSPFCLCLVAVFATVICPSLMNGFLSAYCLLNYVWYFVAILNLYCPIRDLKFLPLF